MVVPQRRQTFTQLISLRCDVKRRDDDLPGSSKTLATSRRPEAQLLLAWQPSGNPLEKPAVYDGVLVV